MEYPQNLIPTLEALYQLGRQICDEVDASQVDLVVGLAHSGWMPVTVAQTLWAETHTTPFPPSVRTNIGQEKHEIYNARFQPPAPAYCCGECCSGSPDRLGHYLAWIAVQDEWLAALQAQVRVVYTEEPGRILVVDDVFGGYRTCYLAMGLLETLYPNANISMVTGDDDLTNTFVEAWVLQFSPDMISEITPDKEPSPRKRYVTPWQELLKPLVTGSEDITPESLGWRPLSAGSAAVQALAGRANPETILAAPAWAESLACDYALQRLQGKPVPEGWSEYGSKRTFLLKIKPAVRLFRSAWINNGVTRKDVEQIYGNLPEELAEGFKQLKEDSQPHGRGRGAVFMPHEATESWVNAYDPPDLHGSERKNINTHAFDVLMPGQLWAGAYPHYNPDFQLKLCSDLLALGITNFVDLTTATDFNSRHPYQEPLALAGQQTSLEVEYIHFPLGFRRAPTRRQMSALLELIQSRLNAGQKIYLHAGHNLEGCAPLVLACLLVNQGVAPQDALRRVSDFWLKTLPYLIRLPLTEPQRQFVLNWKKLKEYYL